MLPALEGLEGVKGRLEIAGSVRGALIVIDYAHKPDALIAALAGVAAVRAGPAQSSCSAAAATATRASGRSWGASPPSMPTTSSSPTTTRAARRPAAIRAEILAGAPGAREIGDRAEAIRAGMRLLGHGDVLLIAGKGHETGQIVGSRVLPFSDHEAVRAALAEAPIDA